MVNRGTGTVKRHGKNYIHEQAQRRFNEAVSPYQSIGSNALKVDSLEVIYYHVTKSTHVCTCKRVSSESAGNPNLSPVLEKPKSISDQMVKIELHRPLFGFGEQNTVEDEEDDDEFALDDDAPTPMVDHILQSSDCGICYKQGFVPGYTPLGYEHRLLGVHNISDIYGYGLDRSQAPTKFLLEDPVRGYADFEIDVPLFFQTVRFSVRDNVTILRDALVYLSYTGMPLTVQDLRDHAGVTIKIRLKAEQFTHAVIDFDVGATPIKVNLSQGNKTLDWTMFDTFGAIQAVLPVSVPEVAVGDVLCVPSRGQSFKVTDVTFLRTARDQALDWSVNVRILQPQEYLKHISSAQQLY